MTPFHEPILGFHLHIPDGWVQLPSAWVKKFRQAAAPTSEQLAAMLNQADAPFLCLYLPQDHPQAAMSSMQCMARPAEVTQTLGGLPGTLNVVSSYLFSAFPDLVVLERLEDYLLAGLRGAYLKAGMTVINSSGERFACISELIVLKSARVLYVIGLSGPAQDELRPSGDFAAMLHSLRID